MAAEHYTLECAKAAARVPASHILGPGKAKAFHEAYRQGQGSLRQLAERFGTSVGMVQRNTRNL